MELLGLLDLQVAYWFSREHVANRSLVAGIYMAKRLCGRKSVVPPHHGIADVRKGREMFTQVPAPGSDLEVGRYTGYGGCSLVCGRWFLFVVRASDSGPETGDFNVGADLRQTLRIL